MIGPRRDTAVLTVSLRRTPHTDAAVVGRVVEVASLQAVRFGRARPAPVDGVRVEVARAVRSGDALRLDVMTVRTPEIVAVHGDVGLHVDHATALTVLRDVEYIVSELCVHAIAGVTVGVDDDDRVMRRRVVVAVTLEVRLLNNQVRGPDDVQSLSGELGRVTDEAAVCHRHCGVADVHGAT